jgi:hypothetical protein
MATATVDIHDLARRGEAYYDEHLRAKIETEHKGEFLVLDVETGDYELGTSQAAALERAIAKHPGTVFHIQRVGYRAAARIGARFRQS